MTRNSIGIYINGENIDSKYAHRREPKKSQKRGDSIKYCLEVSLQEESETDSIKAYSMRFDHGWFALTGQACDAKTYYSVEPGAYVPHAEMLIKKIFADERVQFVQNASCVQASVVSDLGNVNIKVEERCRIPEVGMNGLSVQIESESLDATMLATSKTVAFFASKLDEVNRMKHSILEIHSSRRNGLGWFKKHFTCSSPIETELANVLALSERGRPRG